MIKLCSSHSSSGVFPWNTGGIDAAKCEFAKVPLRFGWVEKLGDGENLIDETCAASFFQCHIAFSGVRFVHRLTLWRGMFSI